MSEPVQLPYHCSALNADYFKPPCAAQVAAAQAHRAKFPHAVMPYGLEQCWKCQGRDLVTREIPTIRANRTVQKEDPMDYPEMIASDLAVEAPRCPKHPAEPQVACGPDTKRAGQYLGACKICMAERKGQVQPADKMTPAVKMDLGIAAASLSVRQVAPPVRQIEPVQPEIDVQIPTPSPVIYPDPIVTASVPVCKNPDCPTPGSPAKIDKLGRSTGFCVECLAARGRQIGIENHERKLSSAPVSIPLNQAKYAEIRQWLEAQAEENERTLQAEIMYVLKLAMREASAHD